MTERIQTRNSRPIGASSMFRRSLVCCTVVLTLASSACSSARFSRAQDCALVGGGVAVAGGIVYVATKNDVDGGEAAAVIGGSLVGGALAGYLLCVATDTGP